MTDKFAVMRNVWRSFAIVALFIVAGVNSARGVEKLPPPLNAQAADREASEFITQFNVVRVGITAAPGNGHQAYAIIVMKRLRELGFKGVFEVFYDPAVKAKLAYMIPGFRADGPEIQKLEALNGMTAIEWKKNKWDALYASESALGNKKVALGFMGGDDKEITPKHLNVDALITVQPSGFRAGSVALDAHPLNEWKDLEDAELLPTHLSRTEFANAADFLQKEMGHSPKSKAKIPGLQALLENLDHLEVMAAYGLSYREGPKKLANLIAGISIAKKAHPDRFKGPVVIPLLSSFNEKEWNEFDGYLAHYPEIKRVVKIQGSSDPDTGKTIRNLMPQEILLMPVGSVSQNVWNLLVERSSLPPALAGHTGVNFAKFWGRPYFNTETSIGVVPEVASKNPAVSDVILAAHRGMKLNPSAFKSSEILPQELQSLAKYIAESMNSSSELRIAFAQDSARTRLIPDKVSVSLIQAKKNFEAHWVENPKPGIQMNPHTHLEGALNRKLRGVDSLSGRTHVPNAQCLRHKLEELWGTE